MDERYDPAFQRGSGGEPGEQPGRTINTPANGTPRRHPIHDDNHRRSLGSSRVHGETAGSMRRGAAAERVDATAQRAAQRPEHLPADHRATPPLDADAEAADAPVGIDIFRSVGAVPTSSADADATLSQDGTAANAVTDAGADEAGEPNEPLLLDGYGDSLDAPRPRGRRNPWEGALWFIGAALTVIGGSALWQSFQMLNRSYSWEDGPPADYAVYQFASAIAPGFLTLGIATLIGLLFARMLSTERKARA
ncbi:hypothetical protein ACL9RL_01260 [Plantibacter sp. Mn2098]|uniref:hypothetical protein n=1 Tax=Plantibacter sp. Mn2098 TaxID=3395266 RepID=UPI003BBF0E67